MDARIKEWGRRLLRSPILPFATLSIFLLFVHEPWRDEAEAWLIARDTPTLGAFFQAMRYEGTPPLWHLMLRTLSHLGFPFMAGRVLHAVCAVAGITLLWFRSPFKEWQRWLICFGYYTAYEYDAITRSYALLALLLFMVATLDRERFQRPVAYGISLAALALATLHGLIFAGILAAAHALEVLQRRSWTWRTTRGGAIAALGMLVSIYGMRQPPDLAHRLSDWVFYPWDLPKSFIQAFLPVPGSLYPFWNTSFSDGLPGFAKLVLLAGILVATTMLLRHNGRALGLFLAIAAAMESLFVFRYYAGSHHAGLLYLAFLFCFWLASEARPNVAGDEAPRRKRISWHNIVAVCLPFLLIVQVSVAAVAVMEDANGKFSGSKATAHYLESSGILDNGTFLAFYRGFSATSVLVQMQDTNRQVFSPEYGRFLTYTPWAQPYQDGYHMTLDQVLAKIDDARTPGQRTVLVVYDHCLGPIDQDSRMQHIAGFGEPSIGSDEVFDIYLVA